MVGLIEQRLEGAGCVAICIARSGPMLGSTETYGRASPLKRRTTTSDAPHTRRREKLSCGARDHGAALARALVRALHRLARGLPPATLREPIRAEVTRCRRRRPSKSMDCAGKRQRGRESEDCGVAPRRHGVIDFGVRETNGAADAVKHAEA